MDVIKPQPLIMGGKAYYTLASTDPVQVELVVPQVTDAEVEMALQSIAQQAGVEISQATDPAWLEENFGTRRLDDVREGLRAQMTDANYSLLEQQRTQACAAELATRLNQSVPPALIDEVRQQLEANFSASLRAGGTSLDEMIAQTGADRLSIMSTFDEQAKLIAEQDAALATFARDRKLDVAVEDYPRLLHMPASQVLALVDQARAVGQEQQIRESALRNRALEIVVAESICTYRKETDEEAAKRVERLSMQARRGPVAPPAAPRPTNPNLKLV